MWTWGRRWQGRAVIGLALAAVPVALIACGGEGASSEGASQEGAPAAQESGPPAGGGAQGTPREQELARLIEGAKAEGKVIWWDGLDPEESGPVIEAFEAKYPFIQVEHMQISDNESRERILREMMAGIVNVDLFDVGGELFPTFREAGVLEAYDWTVAFDVKPEQLQEQQLSLAIGASAKGIGYNTNLLKKEDRPQKWEDLLDPKWKGKKFVVDSRPKTFVHLMPAWGEERVLDFLRKLAAQDPEYRRGQSETIQLMAAGEVAMIAGSYGHQVLLAKDDGAPVELAFLDPVPVTLEDESIAKGAAHPNAAKLLLGWLATEGNALYDRATHRGLPLPGFPSTTSELIGDRSLSVFEGDWIERESELQDKAIAALGLN